MIKIFSFIKNEIKIIDDWILYHSNLFGIKNIFIIDHMSTDGTEIILKKWIEKGLNVYKCNKSFNFKFKELTNLMSKHKNEDCFLIPLDSDEFIVLDNGFEINTDKNSIINQINYLEKGSFRYKFSMRNNIPSEKKVSKPTEECVFFGEKILVGYRNKTFYYSKNFISTDQGNHFGNVIGNGIIKDSGLTLLHYNYYDKDHFIEKITRGAKAYGHDKSINGNGGNGIHYKKNYWRIKNGESVQDMLPKKNEKSIEFNLFKNFITN